MLYNEVQAQIRHINRKSGLIIYFSLGKKGRRLFGSNWSLRIFFTGYMYRKGLVQVVSKHSVLWQADSFSQRFAAFITNSSKCLIYFGQTC